MKVIDLLNKIANGEEVPKKIKINGIIYEYQGDDYLYKDDDKKEYWLFSAGYTDKFMWLDSFLKTKIEILEEEKKIPEKIDHLIGYDIQQFEDLKEYVEITTNDLFGKENKIIDILNEIIDYLKSKGE